MLRPCHHRDLYNRSSAAGSSRSCRRSPYSAPIFHECRAKTRRAKRRQRAKRSPEGERPPVATSIHDHPVTGSSAGAAIIHIVGPAPPLFLTRRRFPTSSSRATNRYASGCPRLPPEESDQRLPVLHTGCQTAMDSNCVLNRYGSTRQGHHAGELRQPTTPLCSCLCLRPLGNRLTHFT